MDRITKAMNLLNSVSYPIGTPEFEGDKPFLGSYKLKHELDEMLYQKMKKEEK